MKPHTPHCHFFIFSPIRVLPAADGSIAARAYESAPRPASRVQRLRRLHADHRPPWRAVRTPPSPSAVGPLGFTSITAGAPVSCRPSSNLHRIKHRARKAACDVASTGIRVTTSQTAPCPRRRSTYRLTLILMRIGMFWIPPGEFRISKTPLSILLVPEYDPLAAPSEPESHCPRLARGDVYDAGGGKPDPAHRLRRRSVTQTGARE